MKVQKGILPNSEHPVWMVLDDDYLPIEPIQKYLHYLFSVGRSPNTIQTYAHNLKLFWEFLRDLKLDWLKINLEQLSNFIYWLRNPNKSVLSIQPQVSLRCEKTINHCLTTVCGFYEFQERIGVTVKVDAERYQLQPGRKYKPFLHHISKGKEVKTQLLKMKEPSTFPGCLTPEQVNALVESCNTLRDKFLIRLLYETGLRIGEALGLRHEDMVTGKTNEIRVVPRLNNVNHVRAKAKVERTGQLISTGHEILEFSYNATLEIQEILEQSERKIFHLTTNKQDKFKPQVISDCLHEVFLELQQGHQLGFSTGLTDLDTLIGGFNQQDLIVIAARASMGKTWLGCHLANYIATQQQLTVVFFSAEMSKAQLTKRFLAMHSSIDSSRLIRNQIYRDEIENLKQGLMALKHLPIIIDDTPASIQNPSRICSVLRRIKSERGNLGLIVMDYIQKLGDRASGNRAQAIGKFSGAFKDIAKEFDVAFVTLAQINRGVENQTNKRPTMADIKDSGDIEQDMDIGLLLYRDEYYNPDTQDKGVMEINVAKNRNGATGICKVLFSPHIGTFANAMPLDNL